MGQESGGLESGRVELVLTTYLPGEREETLLGWESVWWCGRAGVAVRESVRVRRRDTICLPQGLIVKLRAGVDLGWVSSTGSVSALSVGDEEKKRKRADEWVVGGLFILFFPS